MIYFQHTSHQPPCWRSGRAFLMGLENGSTSYAFEQNVYQYDSAFCFHKLEPNRFSRFAATDPNNFIVELSHAKASADFLSNSNQNIYFRFAGNRRTVRSIIATGSSERGTELNATRNYKKYLE